MRNRTCIKAVSNRWGDQIIEKDTYVYTIDSDGLMWIFNDKGSWVELQRDENNNFVRQDRGQWECDGHDEIKISNDTKVFISRNDEGWTDKPQSEDTPTLDVEFSCVTSGLASMGLSFQITDNLYVVATLKSGTKWYFYKTKPDVRPWVEVANSKITLQGTWSCLGESNFQLTRSDGKTFVGGDTSWKDETQSGTTTEPTHDETKFPLKKGSRGPEVVQLQNYLNKQIPQDPLVTDGIFGDKTYNKLVQLQKSTGLI
jgi:hypothetical protein